MPTTDTIAAIATNTPGAIGILRLSGPNAIQAVSRVFTPAAGGLLSEKPPRTLVYGTLHDKEGAVIDYVLATYTSGPASYTGEDTAELHCHGSAMVQALGLEALFCQGCRQAQPGEFTKRAFLNGKLDLPQAEAVADLIDATTAEGARHAAGQLSGALSRRIQGVYAALVDLTAHFCAALDYPDEDIDPFRSETIQASLSQQAEALTGLLATWRRGRQVTSGIPCAIVGRPNAGKSSLLNALLGYERAIVTPIAGTTRDTVEERAVLGGVTLHLIDTAGLRSSDDPVEQLGVQRSRQALERAELVLVLVDQSQAPTQEDLDFLQSLGNLEGKSVMIVYTKCDLPTGEGAALLLVQGTPVVRLSARTGAGLDALEREIAALFPPGQTGGYGELLTNLRQAQAVQAALEAVQAAAQALASGMTPDAVLYDVESAIRSLGELTGRTVSEDITSRIFERFCVGK